MAAPAPLRMPLPLPPPALLLLLLLLLAPAAPAAAPTSCPAACSCSNQASRVICTRRELLEVPASISVNTRYLNLQENHIQVIRTDTFKHLRHLEILQLSRNLVRKVEVGAFNGLPNLNTLELFDNRLTTVPTQAFEYLSKLRELWLRNNPIESIPSYAFNRVPSLRRLDLGELKRLEYISEAAFEGLVNLRYLNLGMCNLKEIPNLTALVRLEELELSGNRLGRVRPGSFQGLGSLRKLWLMHARVAAVERNAFDDLKALEELNLAHNELASLPHDLFAPLHRLERVHLHHNPWRCDCDVLWLSWWLRETVPSNTSCCARCHAPPALRGRYLGELEPGHFTCYAPVIVEPPADLNVTEGMAAELKCRTGTAMTSVNWLTPNGTLMTHGSYRVRISVLHDGTLNFTNVTVQDTGQYTCMVTNAAGNTTASATLNVSAAGTTAWRCRRWSATTSTVTPPSPPITATAGRRWAAARTRCSTRCTNPCSSRAPPRRTCRRPRSDPSPHPAWGGPSPPPPPPAPQRCRRRPAAAATRGGGGFGGGWGGFCSEGLVRRAAACAEGAGRRGLVHRRTRATHGGVRRAAFCSGARPSAAGRNTPSCKEGLARCTALHDARCRVVHGVLQPSAAGCNTRRRARTRTMHGVARRTVSRGARRFAAEHGVLQPSAAGCNARRRAAKDLCDARHRAMHGVLQQSTAFCSHPWRGATHAVVQGRTRATHGVVQ